MESRKVSPVTDDDADENGDDGDAEKKERGDWDQGDEGSAPLRFRADGCLPSGERARRPGGRLSPSNPQKKQLTKATFKEGWQRVRFMVPRTVSPPIQPSDGGRVSCTRGLDGEVENDPSVHGGSTERGDIEEETPADARDSLKESSESSDVAASSLEVSAGLSTESADSGAT